MLFKCKHYSSRKEWLWTGQVFIMCTLMVSQDASKKAANDSCLTPQEIQVYGTIAQVYQAVISCSISSGVTSLQHIWWCCQLRSDVWLGSCCCSLWKVRHFHVYLKLLLFSSYCQFQAFVRAEACLTKWRESGRGDVNHAAASACVYLGLNLLKYLP